MPKKTTTKAEYGLEQFRTWLNVADRILRGPPTLPWVERPIPKGDCVAKFVLPLALCPLGNSMKRKADWQHASLKEKLFKLMAMQEMAFRRRVRCPSMLQGRPMVFCVRFSSAVPDSVTDLAKEAIDKLCQDAIRKNPRTGNVTHIQRLGYLKDDSPRWVEIRQWTEKVPPGEGFVLIQIWTGAP